MTITCPACGEGEREYECYMDSDGDGAWTQTYVMCEPIASDCDCDLTAEQQELAEKLAADAWYAREPL